LTAKTEYTAIALQDIPQVKPNDDVVQIILQALQAQNQSLHDGDVIVIASKIISKAEGCFVTLADVVPDDEACAVAEKTHKDPRIVSLILSESNRISRMAPNVLVTEHRLGFVSANAGIDQSNVGTEGLVLLLPKNPDASAEKIRAGLVSATQANIAVIISDTHGRPFRLGNVGVAIGVAGMSALVDERGKKDLYGRTLIATVQGYADMGRVGGAFANR
jgi:coenzyme F420-0:L-glutamate ligase/coenzyme F420-1:gamma-L-glutamate ligase